MLIDPFERHVTYLRVSVTDRCDFRCVYCMSEHMSFLPKAELLTLEELDRLCSAFVRLGVRKLRITGGEPLVRKGIIGPFESLGRHLRSGALDELTLTTNGSQLAAPRGALLCRGRAPGERLPRHPRSLTSSPRSPAGGGSDQVMAGIEAAKAPPGSGSRSTPWRCAASTTTRSRTSSPGAADEGHDITFIETMPLGEIGGETRFEQYLPLSLVRAKLRKRWTLDRKRPPHGRAGPLRDRARDRPAPGLHHAADPQLL